MIFFDRGIESTISFIGIYILKGAPQRDIIYRPRIDLTLLIFALKRGRERKEISFFPIISLSRLLNCNFALQHDDNIKLIRFNKKKKKLLIASLLFLSYRKNNERDTLSYLRSHL